MNKLGQIPAWAVTNTVLLFAPVVLGFGVFGMWFLPNPALTIPALVVLLLYYTVVLQICRHTSRAESIAGSMLGQFRKINASWREYALSGVGLAMFLLFAYAGLYVTSAAWITSAVGDDVTKEFTVSAFYDPHQRRCDYKLILKEVSPVIGKGFCINSGETRAQWVRDSKVVLSGKESIFGFRFTRIGS
jgi:hypothetical protein